mgnify:FL=1
MRAEDTIMSEKQVGDLLSLALGRNYLCSDGSEIVTIDCFPLHKTQAKISFEAGYNAGLREQGSPRADLENELADDEFRKAYHIARINTDMELYKAGIGEVVEWVNQISGSDEFTAVDGKVYQMLTILRETWQAKLKELGIEWRR